VTRLPVARSDISCRSGVLRDHPLVRWLLSRTRSHSVLTMSLYSQQLPRQAKPVASTRVCTEQRRPIGRHAVRRKAGGRRHHTNRVLDYTGGIAILCLFLVASPAARGAITATEGEIESAQEAQDAGQQSPEELLGQADRLFDAKDYEGAGTLYREFASAYSEHPSADYATKLAAACEAKVAAFSAEDRALAEREQAARLAKEAERLLRAGLTEDAGARAAMALRIDPANEQALAVRKAAETARQQPRTVVEAEAGVKFVLISSGSFTMGCTVGDRRCDRDEKPTHAVEISKPFQLAETETTNAQYQNCVEAGVCRLPGDYSAFEEPEKRNHPVLFVSWHDAAKFCEWLGGRLPREAEWEYAARGGKQDAVYPWGIETPLCRASAPNGAKFDDKSFCNATGTETVASFTANGFGLYDMAGNAWEWVQDWYHKGYYARSPSVDPPGPGGGKLRVSRGGSWLSPTMRLRTSNRLAYDPNRRLKHTGFRCAR